MSKPIFKIVDNKGRLTLPHDLRASLGIEKGDVIGVTAGRGSITIKKAVVLADESMPMEAKECYVQAVVREFDSKSLVGLLELIARLIQEMESGKNPS